MPAVGLTSDEHARVFGPKDDLGNAGPGRSRRCRSCGDWHRLDRPWPHNCRPEAKPRNPELSAPQLAPAFEPFRTGVLEGAVVIGSRNDKREHMKRNDLVEYDAGITNAPTWAEEKAQENEIVETIKMYREIDSENLSPDLKATPIEQSGSLDDGGEINTTDIEVIK